MFEIPKTRRHLETGACRQPEGVVRLTYKCCLTLRRWVLYDGNRWTSATQVLTHKLKEVAQHKACLHGQQGLHVECQFFKKHTQQCQQQ